MRPLSNLLSSLWFFAPDGTGGGGAPPGETAPGGNPLDAWMKRLETAEEKDRPAIVEELAKSLGVKPGDAYKKLKEAGWDPKGKGAQNPNPGEKKKPEAAPPRKTVPVTLRHTTPYPQYRREGLLLTRQFRPYTVTAEQLAVLKRDAWIEFQTPPEPDKS